MYDPPPPRSCAASVTFFVVVPSSVSSSFVSGTGAVVIVEHGRCGCHVIGAGSSSLSSLALPSGLRSVRSGYFGTRVVSIARVTTRRRVQTSHTYCVAALVKAIIRIAILAIVIINTLVFFSGCRIDLPIEVVIDFLYSWKGETSACE